MNRRVVVRLALRGCWEGAMLFDLLRTVLTGVANCRWILANTARTARDMFENNETRAPLVSLGGAPRLQGAPEGYP